MKHMQHQKETRIQRFRARRKAQGMKELRLWVPDTNRPEFAREMKRQLTLVESHPEDKETLTFIENAADWND